jgi:glutaredoxin
MSETKVPGEKKADIFLFTLSTCVWCKKTKNLLKELGVEYRYIDVDQLQGDERKKIIEKLKEKNPSCSYPTILIDDSTIIVGFKEKEIREALA